MICGYKPLSLLYSASYAPPLTPISASIFQRKITLAVLNNLKDFVNFHKNSLEVS